MTTFSLEAFADESTGENRPETPPSIPPSIAPSVPPAGPTPGVPSDDDLKRALHAFKKRLKLTKLDQESKLGGGRPTTSGKASDVMGIVPPTQFPRDLWNHLAKQGKLKDMGGGFFRLP